MQLANTRRLIDKLRREGATVFVIEGATHNSIDENGKTREC